MKQNVWAGTLEGFRGIRDISKSEVASYDSSKQSNSPEFNPNLIQHRKFITLLITHFSFYFILLLLLFLAALPGLVGS